MSVLVADSGGVAVRSARLRNLTSAQAMSRTPVRLNCAAGLPVCFSASDSGKNQGSDG